jgi:hypothetical protein
MKQLFSNQKKWILAQLDGASDNPEKIFKHYYNLT